MSVLLLNMSSVMDRLVVDRNCSTSHVVELVKSALLTSISCLPTSQVHAWYIYTLLPYKHSTWKSKLQTGVMTRDDEDFLTAQVEEDEDDLFEINLELVTSQKGEFHSVAASRNVLLANCLLPVADISSATPIESSGLKKELCSFLRLSTASIFMMNAGCSLCTEKSSRFSH